MIDENSIICPHCGDKMIPVWITEEETKISCYGSMYKTGRKRKNISHFQCPSCFKIEIVDDSFAEPWH